MRNKASVSFSAFAALFLSIQISAAAIALVPGHFYSANYFERTINEYGTTGQQVGTFTVSSVLADQIRGLTFGPDGRLYATAVRGGGFAVLVFDSNMNVQETYTMANVYLNGDICYGRITVDSQHIYVSGGSQITRFDIGNFSSGIAFYQQNSNYNVAFLPNGNMLAAGGYTIDEISTSGNLIKQVVIPGVFYNSIRGVEYSALTNDIFITSLGGDQLMRIDGTTYNLEVSKHFNAPGDIFLTSSGSLLVGSRFDAPVILDQNFNQIGTLGIDQRMFVTEYVIPEPSASAMLGLGLIGVLLAGRRIRA